MGQSSQMDKDVCPKWLLELENRKRKSRLAHEVGAGAPCLKCDIVCPGLDLHFWRKICKNCKCGRDDHDVACDEFPQFDLLLGSSNKFRREFIVLKVNKQQVDDEETFEWAPPDTTQELAADYMKALPVGKLPIKGSAGAVLRKQQLQKQLPLHDIDHEVCDELSDSERKQFEKYLENLKKYVGQGKVSKIIGAGPFDQSLMTPANASECLSPKHKLNILTRQPSTNLRIPSSFVPRSTYSSASRSLPHSQEQLLHTNKNNASSNNINIAPITLDEIGTPHSEQTVNEPVKLARHHYVLENIENDGKSMVASSNIIGGSHYSTTNFLSMNKLSYNDHRLNETSEIIDNMKDVEQNKIDHSNVAAYGNAIQNNKNDHLISTINETERYVAKNIDQSSLYCDDSRNVQSLPILLQLQRIKSIASDQSTLEHNPVQIPLSDTLKQQSAKLSYGVLNEHSEHSQNPMYTDIIGSTLNKKELSSIRGELMRKYKAKGEAVECSIHHDRITPSISHELRRDNVQNCHHAPSIDSINTDINIQPKQTHIKSYRNPENTVILSEKLQYPVFSDNVIGTSRMPIDNLPLSIDHLSINQRIEPKVQKCHECDKAFHAGDVVVTAEKALDAAWHPGCFVCCVCNELLVDLVYLYYKGKLYCARDLASLMQIPRCLACDELIFVCEYTVAEGHNYHLKHFCCWDCDLPLAGKQYISENDRPLCLQCYQKAYAKLCCTCNKLIAADQQGVAVKNLNFHATDRCFCCYSCNKTLLNGRMAIKENKPFCSKECITMHLSKNINSC